MEEDVHLNADKHVLGSQRCSCYLAVSVFACVIGTAFQHGYNTGVVNPSGTFIKDFLNETYVFHHGEEPSENWVLLVYAVIVAIWTVGGMVGGFSVGFLMDCMGRGGLMVINNLGFIIGAILTMYGPNASSYEMMIIGRFITGISTGIGTGVAPIYLTEIAPIRLRGALAEVDQITVVVGIVVAQAIGLPGALGTSELWPYLFGFPLIPATLQIISLPMCPESPRYLLLNNSNEPEAKAALQKLRSSSEDVDIDIQEIKREQDNQDSDEKVTVCSLFKVPHVRRALLVAAMLNAAQQLSGINTVTYFSNSTFLSLGFSINAAYFTTLGLYILQLILVIVSSLIIEKVGRRLLLILGFSGMAGSAIILTVCYNYMESSNAGGYAMIVATGFFVSFFALGPGPIPWFIVGELFSQNTRSLAMGICTGTNWAANFVVAQTFPFMQEYFGDDALIPFILLGLLFATLTWAYLPETKGRPIDDIINELKSKCDEHGGYDDMDKES